MRRVLLLCAAACAHLGGAQPYQYSLTPFGDDSIRIQVAAPGNGIVDPPLSALLAAAPPTRTRAVRAGPLALTNGNLRVDIDAQTSLVTATRVSDGAVLLKQTALAFGAPDVPGTRAGSASARVTFAGTAGEKVYGLGEHRTGAVQQSPYSWRFADSQDYGISHGSDVSIPWYASSLGYGFVWNSPGYGSVSISPAAIEWAANATLNADFWVTTTSATFDPASGRSPYADLLAHYVDAVGHASTMPYYSTGFIQCKDRYRNQTQLLDVAHGYVDRGLPISVIVIDWMHWKAQGDWSFNPTCWPDPQGLVDELQTLGIEPMVTFWPFQTTGSQHWEEFNSQGFLVGNLSGDLVPYDGDQFLIDETSAAVRNATFNGFWEGYGKFGFKTIWLDAAEPEHFGGGLEGTWRLSAGTDAEVNEAWIQQHVRTFAEGFASKGIGPGDYFVLPRHSWAGAWQHSAALWSGDIVSSFDELALQIKVLQGVVMSGVVLWTTDIGGYHGGNPADPVFQDLIVRWFQFGAFCPLFRLHGHRDGGPASDECGGTNGDNEVWNLAPEPAHYAGIVAVMRLRENLREYVSQLNAETAATGMPMVRPMFLQFPLDAGCAGPDVEDQYMFGPRWLVAPVYTQGATSRSVYLPPLANATWVYFFNDSSVGPGGGRVTVPAPIDEFPLFYVRDVPPPPPPQLFNATTLYSAARNDTVLCLSQQCYDDNGQGMDGAYVPLQVEGVGLQADPSGGNLTAVIGGRTYALLPLTLWWSYAHSDNFVSNATAPPDATYTPPTGVTFSNGYALATPPPGGVPLSIWVKDWSGDVSRDYFTLGSGASLTWAQARGYTQVQAGAGWLLPAGTTAV